MTRTGHDTLKTRKTLSVDGKQYDYFSLKDAAAQLGDISKLPFTLKVLLENLIRFEDDRSFSDVAIIWKFLFFSIMPRSIPLTTTESSTSCTFVTGRGDCSVIFKKPCDR